MDSFSLENQMRTQVETVADGLGSKYGLGKLEKIIFQQCESFISFLCNKVGTEIEIMFTSRKVLEMLI
jgi:hypothetical protein